MLETLIERALYASRWLLAPLYLGLSLALLALGLKFFQEVLHLLPNVFELAETELVLTVLALIDITLVGALLIMVMFSGYENFISRIELHEGADKLDWLGKYDAGTLKLKVAASIVAISSIHLLRIHERAADPQRQADVVRHHPPDLGPLGAAARLPRPHGLRRAPRPLTTRGGTPPQPAGTH